MGSRDFILNSFNSRKLNGSGFLVTTEHGSWSFLPKEEYKKFRTGKVKKESELYEHLKDKGLVLVEGNVEDVVKKLALKNQFLFTGPSLHIITTTRRCNHRCLYCHSKPKGSENEKFDLDESTGRKIVDFAMNTPSDVLKFEFQGGEPLLNFETVEKVIDYAERKAEEKNRKVSFSIVTNLTALDEENIQGLRRKNLNVTTSLDGPRDLHNANRKYLGGNGSYGKVRKNIERLRNEGIDVNALCTVTKNSLGRGKEIVEEYRKLDMNYIWLRPLNKIGFAEESWKEVGYTPKEFVNFYSDTLDYILEKDEIKELYAVLLTKKILQVKDPEMTEMTSPCGAGISQLLYDENGNVHTCDEGKIYDEFKLGNVENSIWKDVVTNDTFLSMVDISSKKNYLCGNCPWEPFCAVCPVNTYAEQDTVVSKLPEDFRCQLHGKIIEDIFRRLLFSEDREKLENWASEDKIFG